LLVMVALFTDARKLVVIYSSYCKKGNVGICVIQLPLEWLWMESLTMV